MTVSKSYSAIRLSLFVWDPRLSVATSRQLWLRLPLHKKREECLIQVNNTDYEHERNSLSDAIA